MTTITLDGVTKRYGDTSALSDVDLSVDEGEFFTLLGPSGCGKTTTLRLIAGFETPTAGTIRIGGEDVGGVPPEDRDIGVVFQNYALFPHMTVRENVAYGLRFTDPPGGVTPDERVSDLLGLVDLEGFGGRDPDTLSGGQQQRVALARALAPGPRLLLLDEPLSALDASLRERLRVQLRDIQHELGVTTLYVTHDQEEALAVSDRVAVLNGGEVEQVGAPRTVYREPASRFVAEFVGDNNVFEGRVLATADDELRVAVGDQEFRLTATDVTEPSGPVTFCVRPEHLRIGPAAADQSNRFSVTVENVEFLGESTRVHTDWDGRRITLRVGELTDIDRIAPGEAVSVGFDPADGRLLQGSPATRQ